MAHNSVAVRSEIDQRELDKKMMRRCIRLSAIAGERGEFPFASIICDGERVIAEATNQVAQHADVTRHAELLAISEAQKKLGKKNLSNCSIYSNVEPCVMCSFPMRETRISRVIYAIGSPLMGGFSKWNVLRDSELSNVMPEAFGMIPEVIAGLLQREAEAVWRRWNPLIWTVIKHRGCFGNARESDGQPVHMHPIPNRDSLLRKILTFGINRHSV
jgi:tRNA(adenine34) deaminase